MNTQQAEQGTRDVRRVVRHAVSVLALTLAVGAFTLETNAFQAKDQAAGPSASSAASTFSTSSCMSEWEGPPMPDRPGGHPY